MSAARERITAVRNPTLPSQTTAEQRYWRGFTNSQLVKEHNAVTHINFDPKSPHDFAVTSSTRVQIFSSKTRKVTKSFTRFSDTVYSGEFRHDGKLLVAGDASGLVQVYDAHHPKTLLVTVRPSSHPTHVTKFHPSITAQLLTCSDDRVARLYDISDTQKPLASFGDHQDYVRCGLFVPGSGLIATGCYDNVVRVFDPRSGSSSPVITFNQQSPVEDILSVNPTTLVSCGDNGIKCWDLAAGKCIRNLGNFTKTVTSLCDAGERGILAGSMDGHVKVFDTSSTNWEVKFGWKFGSGVLSCGVSPDHKHLVVGLNSGLLTIRTRKTEPKVPQGVKQAKSHAFARMMRGAEYHGESEHHILDDKVNNNTKKLKQFERDLNGFRWSDALDHAIASSSSSRELTITCLEELKKRGKVRVALSGRSESTLEPLLTWCYKTIDDPRDVSIIADYLGCILEMYSELIDHHPILEELVWNIQKKVEVEIEKCEEAQKITGMLELLSST
ncbi:DEKNAAC103674 [Brettanomyces naardenensis]|uniref:DEKNAAC103674 n=1 Tax=Brettanomyces naardenensis TaxID=13370 RepID=A0A448YN47_BRENA|nr:DEKNAAC103674 [Brettanomyces naardenensis]